MIRTDIPENETSLKMKSHHVTKYLDDGKKSNDRKKAFFSYLYIKIFIYKKIKILSIPKNSRI